MRCHSGCLFESFYEPPSNCQFGISESILGATLGATLGESLGVGATAGGILAGGLEGAGLGAASTLLTGGDPLTSALTGGLSGGAIAGLGPVVSEATGLGSTLSNALVGATAGAAGQGLVGGDPLSGALTGGVGGAASGAFGSSSAPSTAPAAVETSPSAGAGGGVSAASTTSGIAPSGATPVDLTASDAFGISGGGPLNAADPYFAQFGGFQQGSGVGFGNSGGTGGVGGGGTSSGSSGIGSKIMGLVEKNPGVLLGAGLLGANMLMGDKPLPAEAALQQAQGEAASMGRTLAAYQQTGTLPSGLQSVVDQQFDSAKAAVVDQYSRMGLGNSTMMTDKLNALKAQKSAEVAQFADMLAKQGIQWTSLSSQELSQLLNAQAQQEASFNQALGSFAAGLSGLRTGSSSSSG